MLPEFDVSGLSVEEPEGTGSPVSVTVNVVRKGGTMNVVKVSWSASLNSKWDIDIDWSASLTSKWDIDIDWSASLNSKWDIDVDWSASLNSKWDIDVDIDTKSGGSSNCLSLVTENLL